MPKCRYCDIDLSTKVLKIHEEQCKLSIKDDDTTELKKMTVVALKAYAEKNDINLEEATKKADIIAAIEEAEAESGE